MCEELWNTLPYWCVERDVYMYHNIPLYVLSLVEIPLDVLRLVHRPTAVCVCVVGLLVNYSPTLPPILSGSWWLFSVQWKLSILDLPGTA